MPSEYRITTTVKKAGDGGTCLYLLTSWGLTAGQKLYMTIQECDTGNVPQSVTVTVRRANSVRAVKVSVPRTCGFEPGTWVHVSLRPQ